MNIAKLYEEKYLKLIKNNRFSFTATPTLSKLAQKAIELSSSFKTSNEIKTGLEIGHAGGSNLSLVVPNITIKAIDRSKAVTDYAIATTKQDNIDFINVDILDLDKDKQYDLILDSHCLHCLTNSSERSRYFKKIKEILSPRGLFILEHAISSKMMSFDPPYIFSKDSSTLYKSETPIRKIPSALNLEKKIIDHKFKIEYFRASPSHRIIINDSRNEAKESDPDLLQIICSN